MQAVERISIRVQKSMMYSQQIICYEHEVPIYQAVFGVPNVEPMEDTLGRTGPVGEIDLQEEWQRLMQRPRMVKTGSDEVPAPLIAFPRGWLDLEDFYERKRRNDEKPVVSSAVQPPPEAPEPQRRPGALPSASERRAAAKKRLEELGIDYNGNASADELEELLNDVDIAPVIEEGDANVQD